MFLSRQSKVVLGWYIHAIQTFLKPHHVIDAPFVLPEAAARH